MAQMKRFFTVCTPERQHRITFTIHSLLCIIESEVMNLSNIKLITDSTADLSGELLKKYDIDVVPLYVEFPGKSYFDGVDLQTEEMYREVQSRKCLPKTAAASPGAFFELFEHYLKLGKTILYLGIGSKFSATLQSAMTAKKMLESESIYLLDSLNLSSGSGLLLLKAAEMIRANITIETIVSTLETLVPKVRSQFVIDTLEYLYKGGRLNALSTLMGTMLRIKPIIKVREGVMAVGKKGRGSTRNGIDLMLEELFSIKNDVDLDFCMITHSLAHEEALYMKDKIQSQMSFKHIYETPAGCVISSHCGKGTIGVLYIMK